MSPTWLSGGKLTGFVLVLMLPRPRVEQALSAHPTLELGELGGVPKGRHPLCIDAFHVEAGEVELGPRSQDAWLQGTAKASAGALAGALGAWGAGLSATANAVTGAALGLSRGPFDVLRGGASGLGSGARAGAMLGLGLAQETSRLLEANAHAYSALLTRSLGDYREVLFGIPGVTSRGRGPFLFVLEMLSDGAAAIAADRAFGYGFHKRPARFDCGSASWQVATSGGEPLFEVKDITRRPRGRGRRRSLALDWLCQPLLGATGRGKLALSLLEREFGADDGTVPLSALSLGTPALSTRLLDGPEQAPALDAKHPWGAATYDEVRVRISLPRPFV